MLSKGFYLIKKTANLKLLVYNEISLRIYYFMLLICRFGSQIKFFVGDHMYSVSPIEYLDSLLIDYILVPHRTSFTAQATAESAHIKDHTLSKVIVIGSGFRMSMVVVPANCIVLQSDLAQILNTPSLNIIPESQFADRFPECEVGAMPPFGKLYGMDVYAAKEILEKKSIIFNGGTHNLLIKMSTRDFLEVSGAKSISFGYKAVTLANARKAQDKNRLW